jgi:hypothetical protein
MEQKQRRVKANPFGDLAEEEGDALPAPPPIDDLVRAAEMAAEEQRKAKAQAKPILSLGELKRLGGKAESERIKDLISSKDGWKDAAWKRDPEVMDRAKTLWAGGLICVCGDESCPIGPFVVRGAPEESAAN